MKIFVSWSKETSHKVALALREWLPQVIQQVDPWVSSEDIAKGDRGGTAIARELAGTDQGVICLTKANVREPWLNFEAGALSKHAGDETRVRTVLFDLKATDVTGPLSDFQHTNLSDKSEVFKFVESINRSCEPSLKDAVLSKSFEKNWPDLVDALDGIRQSLSPQTPESRTAVVSADDESSDAAEDRNVREIAEETLERVRAIEREQRRQYLAIREIAFYSQNNRPRRVISNVGSGSYFIAPGMGPASITSLRNDGSVVGEVQSGKYVGQTITIPASLRDSIDYFETANEAEAFWANQVRAAVESNEDAQALLRQVKQEAWREFGTRKDETERGV